MMTWRCVADQCAWDFLSNVFVVPRKVRPWTIWPDPGWGGGGGCRDRLVRDCRGRTIGILDVVHFRVMWSSFEAPRQIKVSASICCDYPPPGCGTGSGHIGQGWFGLGRASKSGGLMIQVRMFWDTLFRDNSSEHHLQKLFFKVLFSAIFFSDNLCVRVLMYETGRATFPFPIYKLQMIFNYSIYSAHRHLYFLFKYVNI
jgi:hypothetical protein